jgi:hypothetical protein
MNGSKEPEADNKASVLLKFYTRKVFSRIRPSEKPKTNTAPEKPGR